MKKAGKIIAYMAIIAGYAAVSFLIMYLVSKSGVYPSGSDTMCHIYKGSVLYQQIKQGNWYPLFDPMWYNGVEMMRYWAPLPVYFLAMCQAFAGGDCFGGYLIFLGLVSFFGAVVWFFIGCRHKRPCMGAVIGLLWFFMPNNLLAIFVEGNLPRALCMVVLPLFVANVHDYLLDGRWKSLPADYHLLCVYDFVPYRICRNDRTGAACISGYLPDLYRQRRRIFEVLFAVILGFALTGILDVCFTAGRNHVHGQFAGYAGIFSGCGYLAESVPPHYRWAGIFLFRTCGISSDRFWNVFCKKKIIAGVLGGLSDFSVHNDNDVFGACVAAGKPVSVDAALYLHCALFCTVQLSVMEHVKKAVCHRDRGASGVRCGAVPAVSLRGDFRCHAAGTV